MKNPPCTAWHRPHRAFCSSKVPLRIMLDSDRFGEKFSSACPPPVGRCGGVRLWRRPLCLWPRGYAFLGGELASLGARAALWINRPTWVLCVVRGGAKFVDLRLSLSAECVLLVIGRTEGRLQDGCAFNAAEKCVCYSTGPPFAKGYGCQWCYEKAPFACRAPVSGIAEILLRARENASLPVQVPGRRPGTQTEAPLAGKCRSDCA